MDWKKTINKDRYTSIGNYKIDRWIFQTVMVVIFAYLFWVAYSQDFQLDYYKCAVPTKNTPLNIFGNNNITDNNTDECLNPFYKPITWKNYEYLPPGEYGNKPGFIFNSLWPVTIGILVIGVMLNHLIYNNKRGGEYADRNTD